MSRRSYNAFSWSSSEKEEGSHIKGLHRKAEPPRHRKKKATPAERGLGAMFLTAKSDTLSDTSAPCIRWGEAPCIGRKTGFKLRQAAATHRI